MAERKTVRICSAQILGIWKIRKRHWKKPGLSYAMLRHPGEYSICFPEQFATGWDPRSGKNIQGIDGIIVTSLREMAKENAIAILGSFRERHDPLPKNTAVAIGSDGSILGTYAKMHLFSHGEDKRGFPPGTGLGIFTIGSLRCGIAICYDLRFPEPLPHLCTERGPGSVRRRCLAPGSHSSLGDFHPGSCPRKPDVCYGNQYYRCNPR